MRFMKNYIPKKFENEKLANHWKVSEDKRTFDNLMLHLQVKTHLYFGFMQSVGKYFELNKDNEIIIADIGGGVGWSWLPKPTKVRSWLCRSRLLGVNSYFAVLLKI